jgi:hypothetical protein
MTSIVRRRGGRVALASIALGAAFAAPPMAAYGETQISQDISLVKAGFLLNFAKFTEWPALPTGAPLAMCVVGNEAIATALAETVRSLKISDHPLDVSRPADSATWRSCHLLFIADAEPRRSGEGVRAVKALPVLTVSDTKDFAQAGGIIEFYVEGGKMRFAINMDALDRSGLHLSSRVLGLAKIVRDPQ